MDNNDLSRLYTTDVYNPYTGMIGMIQIVYKFYTTVGTQFVYNRYTKNIICPISVAMPYKMYTDCI